MLHLAHRNLRHMCTAAANGTNTYTLMRVRARETPVEVPSHFMAHGKMNMDWLLSGTAHSTLGRPDTAPHCKLAHPI